MTSEFKVHFGAEHSISILLGSFSTTLQTHAQFGAESISAYAAHTTDLFSKIYPNFSKNTQLSLSVNHFISGLADSTMRDYLLHDHACRSQTWQETVQIATAYEALRYSLHASPFVASVVSAKVGAVFLDEHTCASAENCVAIVWQQSALDKRSAHVAKGLFREFLCLRKQVEKPLDSAIESFPSTQRDHLPFSKSTTAKNSLLATEENAATSHQNAQATRSLRKCFGCSNVGRVARKCSTLAARAAAHAIAFSSSNAVASARKGFIQLFTEVVIGGVRIADSFIDTGSAVLVLSTAMYGRRPSAPEIQPFTGAASDVVGVVARAP